MAKTKIIEIDSLSKYIRHINKLDNVSYYRGPISLLKSVLLPTLGLPTIAKIGFAIYFLLS